MMNETNTTNADSTLLNLATSCAKSSDARAINMLSGKAWKLINRTYKVETNREAVWQEWCKLADAGRGSWLVKGGN